jgi:hypothetical protein
MCWGTLVFGSPWVTVVYLGSLLFTAARYCLKWKMVFSSGILQSPPQSIRLSAWACTQNDRHVLLPASSILPLDHVICGIRRCHLFITRTRVKFRWDLLYPKPCGAGGALSLHSEKWLDTRKCRITNLRTIACPLEISGDPVLLLKDLLRPQPSASGQRETISSTQAL